jgi:hypothetical protein
VYNNTGITCSNLTSTKMARCLFEMFDKLEAKSNAKASNNSK